MALIDEQNLALYLSGGESVPDNRYAHNSLGGARSVAQMGNFPGNLFPSISAAEALAGITSYRCVYLRNDDENAAGLLDGKLYVAVSTPAAGTEIDVGLAPEGLNGVAELIPDELTAPTGVTFSHPTGLDDAIALPASMVEGDQIAVWMRRTVSPGAESSSWIDYGVLVVCGRSVE